MKIIGVEAVRMDITYVEEMRTSFMTYKNVGNALVRVRTDAGIVGYGEVNALPAYFGDTPEGILSAINVILEPAVIGCNPLDTSQWAAFMDRALYSQQNAKSGIDMAVWDIIGQFYGQPLYQLFGGMIRNGFPTTRAIGWDEPERMLQDALKHISEGYTNLVVKLSDNVFDDLARATALLENLDPEICIIFDPNSAWSVVDTIHIGRRLAHYDNNFYLEQPSPKDDITGLAEIRQAVPVRIIADETVRSPRDLYRLVRLGAADMVNIKVSKLGGFTKSLEAIAVAKAAGIPYRVDCMVETKIANTAGAHLAAATRHSSAGLDSHLDCQSDPVIEGGLIIDQGCVFVSAEPGIGIKIDPNWDELLDEAMG